MRRWRVLLLTTSALLPMGLASALAGPNGASVVAGVATVSGQGTASVVVNQSSQSAIINWNTFNIGAGEKTAINMPGASSVELDRVTGALGPSQILGSLTSNGNVFLVNRDGILFGPGATINVGGLLATTHDIANSDFMAGNYNFTISGNPSASIVNQGAITARTGGFAALVAPGVRNTGTISARLGTIALASGNVFTLDLYGDNLITLGLNDSIAANVTDVSTGQPLSALVSNSGKLKADGGTIQLTAVAARQVVDSVINNTGVVEANTVGTHNGMIVLGAATGANAPAGAPAQTVKVSGTLSAAGKHKGTTGGTIEVTGENVQLSGANINASGRNGGGAVLIGGDWGGGNPNTSLVSNPSAYLEPYAVPNASTVSADAATTINASATDTGSGGKVIVWSNDATTFYGTIYVQSGAQSGNGGFVETSGHQLSFGGSVNTSAPNGVTGTLLLDPLNAIIAATVGSEVITVSSIQNALASGDVVVTTVGTTGSEAGDITVAASLSWANASTLTLNSYRDIDINSGVTISNTGAGNLVLRADATGLGTGTLNFTGTSHVDFSNSAGFVSVFYNPADNPAGSTVNATSFTSPNSYTPYVLTNSSVPNQLTSYMLVNTVYDLQNIENNLLGVYALGTDISGEITASWNGGAGFSPIGVDYATAPFQGLFDGQFHTINGLKIGANCGTLCGLFGFTSSSAVIRNVGLTDLDVMGVSNWVGGLVGYNVGTIENSFTSGSINGGSAETGGLVGMNWGTIRGSYTSDPVISAGYAGGLVGLLDGDISGCLPFGFGCAPFPAQIINSYATGTVNGTLSAGGLVGYSDQGNVTSSYAIGPTTGGPPAGGIIGTNFSSITPTTSSYWDTQTTGQQHSAGSPDSSGLLTSQFISGLPTGFDPAIWASTPNVNGGYPSLRWQVPIVPSGITLTLDSTVASTPMLTPGTSPFPTGQIYSNFVQVPIDWQIAPAGTFSTLLTPLEKEIYPAIFEATGCALVPACTVFAKEYATQLLLANADWFLFQLNVALAHGDTANAREQLKDYIVQQVVDAVIHQFGL